MDYSQVLEAPSGGFAQARAATRGRMKGALALFAATLCMLAALVCALPQQAWAATAEVDLGMPTWVSGSTTQYTFGELTVPSTVSGITSAAVTVTAGSIDTSGVDSSVQVNTDLNTNHQTVSLSFSSADASYVQGVLRQIVFNYSEGQTVSIDLSNKTTNIPTDATITEYNGHYYMYISSSACSWTSSLSNAASYTYMGRQGYLATVTSQGEDQTLTKISSNRAWSSGQWDTNSLTHYASDFYWAAGPEKGQAVPTATQKDNGWGWGNNEPNDYNYLEDYMCVNYSGGWNDLQDSPGTGYIYGYFVEFGGYAEYKDPGSPQQSLDPIASGEETVKPYSVTSGTTDRITVSPTTVLPGASLSATVTPVAGWDTPTADQITVTMGGTTLTSGTDYTYTAGTSAGTLTITKVTGAVVVSATNMPTWYTANNGANKTALEKALATTDASTLDATELDNLVSGWTSIANTSGAQDAIASDLGTTVDAITQKLNNLNAANDFDTKHSTVKDITSLDPNSSDYATQKAAIEAAKADYDKLSDEAKALLPSDYADAFAALDWAESAKSLYQTSPVTKDNLADLQKLVDSYDKLSDAQKALVKDVYDDIADKLAGAKVLDVNDEIISNPGPVDASDADAIDKALTDYNNLTEDQQKAIDPDGTIKADLEAKKAAADWAKEYEDILSKDASDLTADDIAKLNDAKAAYDALSDDAKAMVDSEVLSDLLNKQSDLFIKTYVSDAAGNIYTAVTADNYEQILSGLSDWNALTQDEKDAINDKLKEATGMTYEEMIEKAEELQASANDFIDKYLTDSYGNIYTQATRDNYAQILSGLDAWNALSQDEKDAINAILVANGGKTYEELLAQAQDIQKQIEAEKATKAAKAAKTGDMIAAAAPFALAAVALAAGALAFAASRRPRGKHVQR